MYGALYYTILNTLRVLRSHTPYRLCILQLYIELYYTYLIYSNYFRHGSLDKIFICFPDPHFKTKNHRRRIISYNMLTEYAYLLGKEGRLYTITGMCTYDRIYT